MTQNIEQPTRYELAVPKRVEDVGVCYYCGCEAECHDYMPRQEDAEFYIAVNLAIPFIKVHSCMECCSLLKKCDEYTVLLRMKYLNEQLAIKYKAALAIFEKWDEQEAVELDVSFKTSILAGIELGKDTEARIIYLGYPVEIDEIGDPISETNSSLYTVYGEEFASFRHALQYVAKAYRININVLKDYLVKCSGDFDEAIDTYYKDEEERKWKSEKKKKSGQFAKKYKQNRQFVERAVDTIKQENPSYTVDQILTVILNKYVKT